MKKYIAAIFIFFVMVSGIFAQSERIVWEKDFKKALQLSRETGRPLLLDFTADWCKPCQEMDKNFWVREDVIQIVKPFIAVKVDFDNDRKTVDKYGISSIPFVGFTDPLGNLIVSKLGFSAKKIEELNTLLEQMPKDFSPLLKLYDALDINKDDGNVLHQIATSYRIGKMLRLSNNFYKKALKTDEIQKDAAKRENIYLSLGVNYLNLRDFDESIKMMEDLLKSKPSDESRETALYFLVLGNAFANKSKEANKYSEMLKTEFPASKYIEKAEAAIRNIRN